MQTSVFFIVSSLFTITLLGGAWQAAQCRRIQQISQTFAVNRELKIGMVLLALTSTIPLIEVLYTIATTGGYHGGTGAYTTTIGIVSVGLIQLLWFTTIVVLSLYVHLLVFAAYSEYDQYPTIVAERSSVKMWKTYRRWTYLFRSQYKSPLFVAMTIVLFGVTGVQVGIPVVLCTVIGVYHTLLVFICSHGNRSINYENETRLLAAPEQTTE